MLPTDPRTIKYITYGLVGTAIALIVVGIFVPSARDYLSTTAKILLTAVGLSLPTN